MYAILLSLIITTIMVMITGTDIIPDQALVKYADITEM